MDKTIGFLSNTGPDMLEHHKVSTGAKTRNRYNQVPRLTQDTNRNVTNSQLNTTNESKEVSPFQAGDKKAHVNRSAQRQTQDRKKHIDPQKKYRFGTQATKPAISVAFRPS